MSAPVTIHIAGTTASTSMDRPQVGQHSTGEQAAAQDALNLLRGHGFHIEYSHAPLAQITPQGQLLHWLGQQPDAASTLDAARAINRDLWTTEAMLEQLYQRGRVGFKAGRGWYSMPRPGQAEEPAPQTDPNQLHLQLPTGTEA